MPRRKKYVAPLVDFRPLRRIGLSRRQVYVLHCLQQAFDLGEISRSLKVTREGVKYHLSRVGTKLQARGKVEIMARAIIETYLVSKQHGRHVLPLM